ncbi:hypothetical protein EDC04DRAFT_1423211 [Pisolithus marmoratus]|nr:hypothetical protein EDC04DRAFT_1423211 [Pisolithus marmoratus]
MNVLFLATRTLLLIFAALSFKSVLWRVISCSVVVALLAADMRLARTGNRVLDYLFGVTLGTTVLQSIHVLLLAQPLEEYRHELDRVPANQLMFLERFFWLLNMTYSPRGIGWSFKIGFNAGIRSTILTSPLDKLRIPSFLLTPVIGPAGRS